MSSRTPSDVLKHIHLITPQLVASVTPVVGNSNVGVDTGGFRWGLVVLNMGVTGSNGTLAVTAAPTLGGTYAAMDDDNLNMTGVANTQAELDALAADDAGTSYYGEIDLEQFDRFLKFTWTSAATTSTGIQAELWLFECRDTLEYIVNDASSIKNLSQFQHLAADKPAW